MKYVRTKDENNLIIDLTDMKLPYNLIDGYIDFNKFGMFKIIKQADTIEELCDAFVEIYNDGTYEITPINDIRFFESYKNHIVYGAIWTDKGLIYVAKMNDKGELELL